MDKRPVYFAQNDSRWSKIAYTSVGNNAQNIGNSGCGPSSFSMVASTFLNKDILPPDCCKDAIAFGCRSANNGTTLSYFTKASAKYGFECRQTKDTNEVVNILKNTQNTLVIANMGPVTYTKGGHYVVIWSADNNYIYSNDPAKLSRDKASIEIFKKESKAYMIITKKDYVPNNDPAPIVKRVLRWKDASGKILSPLMNGDDVKQVQEYLNKNGYNVGTADGKFGQKTHDAVKEWQSKNKLVSDGIIGKASWEVIERG